MIASVLALLPLVLAATANPLAGRQDAPNCEAFGENGFATAGSFHLAAVNTTLPNTNPTGAPLTIMGAGFTTGASSSVLTAWDSSRYPDGLSSFHLENGALQPGDTVPTKSSNSRVEKGDSVTWAQSIYGVQPAIHAWCGVNNADDSGHALLAVHGDVDGFNLCLAGTWENALNEIVWYPSADASYYVPSSCYPVRIHIVQDV